MNCKWAIPRLLYAHFNFICLWAEHLSHCRVIILLYYTTRQKNVVKGNTKHNNNNNNNNNKKNKQLKRRGDIESWQVIDKRIDFPSLKFKKFINPFSSKIGRNLNCRDDKVYGWLSRELKGIEFPVWWLFRRKTWKTE